MVLQVLWNHKSVFLALAHSSLLRIWGLSGWPTKFPAPIPAVTPLIKFNLWIVYIGLPTFNWVLCWAIGCQVYPRPLLAVGYRLLQKLRHALCWLQNHWQCLKCEWTVMDGDQAISSKAGRRPTTSLGQWRRVGGRGHLPPGASRGKGRQNGVRLFFATRNIQKLCELRWGMGMERQTMCIENEHFRCHW